MSHPTPPAAGTTFHVWCVLLGQKVLAAYTSSDEADRSHHARTDDAKIPREPRLAIRGTDGRVFLLGEEIPLGGAMASSDDAIVGRALDQMPPAARAALERARPPAPTK